MNDALYIAATGMQMQQLNVDTVANNLTNVNTPGYKKGRVNFQELVYRAMGNVAADGTATNSMMFGSGVGLSSVAKVFTAGELRKTDSQMDVAIQGNGFLEISLPDGGVAYTRGGSLQVNREGFLAGADGNPLKPSIYVGSDFKEIEIQADGKVFVRSRDQGDLVEVGRIELANFADATGLIAIGENRYRSSEASGNAVYGKPGEDGLGSLAQGYAEASNVKMIDEMVNLMVAQRAYEMSIKVIQASDEMLGMSNNLRRG